MSAHRLANRSAVSSATALLLLLLPLLLQSPGSAGQAGRIRRRGTPSSPSSSPGRSEFTRDDFPPGFVFGAGTSSYQVEGAADEDGKSPSTWDTFTHAGKAPDQNTADVTADEYHKYQEDVKLMSETRLEAYRFSISWSRLVPNGRGDVNPKGLQYYNNLINELVKYGIQPHVTLYHLDLPQALEDEYLGWLSPRIVDDFRAYANICFREFGDRVSHWTTINEPNILGISSYDNGLWPPCRCSYPFGVINCTSGNSSTEPYAAVHNALLVHAAVVELYREKYQAIQRGWIGINVYSTAFSPLTDSRADREATQRANDFMMGWIVEPVVRGDYPETMRKIVGSRLPSFTADQKKRLRGAFDFVGINHYASSYIADRPVESGLTDFSGDISVKFAGLRNETPGSQFVPTNFRLDPAGLERVLEYLKQSYGNPPIYVQENGIGTPYNSTLNDTSRIDALKGYITGMLTAIRNGSDVRGYFVWSFLDVFELLTGYHTRFGLYHVDFEGKERKRQPKLSAIWYRDFLQKKAEHRDA